MASGEAMVIRPPVPTPDEVWIVPGASAVLTVQV
jgi:hypothetical protein